MTRAKIAAPPLGGAGAGAICPATNTGANLVLKPGLQTEVSIMRALVLGSSGGIGAAVCGRLAAAGHRDGDLFEWIARRAGMTRERAERAMTHEQPGDATSFTRVLADLQKIHLSLT